ncbi:MAG: hypothetical protein M3365_09070 [Gemmatimonadota bacterium]|nr:hypothetical protein [Gemmatimonadota bacterium]
MDREGVRTGHTPVILRNEESPREAPAVEGGALDATEWKSGARSPRDNGANAQRFARGFFPLVRMTALTRELCGTHSL